MRRKYEEFLDPDLYYDNTWVSSFVENLNEPEIDEISTQKVIHLSKTIMPTDDIYGLLRSLHQSAQEKIKKTGTLAPEFITFTGSDSFIKFSSDLPQTPQQVENFLNAAKCLSLVRCGQCVFFSAMQPIFEGKPVFSKKADDRCEWGLLTIGSSLRGNCFVMLSKMLAEEDFSFHVLEDKIAREKEYDYPYSHFYNIKCHLEMAEIIKQIPKMVNKTEILTEKDALINFSTSLKSLQMFGH